MYYSLFVIVLEDPTDKDALEAALRETEEEVGINRNKITIIGKLDQILSRRYQVVTPFVGVISSDFEVKPNENEVECILYVPLRFFIDRKTHHSHRMDFLNSDHYSHYFFFAEKDGRMFVIWGLTALVMVRLLEIAFGHNVIDGPHQQRSLEMWFQDAQEMDDEKISNLKSADIKLDVG